MTGILRIGALLAAGYGLMVLLMYLGQQQLLFLPGVPGRELVADPRQIGLEYETVSLESADGVSLHGWYTRVENPRGTVLFFHGNAGNISHRLESLGIFASLGMEVLIIDYRGYGRSEGSPDERGLYRDAEAAWRYLVEERGVAAGQIVIFGRSLGAAVAARTAARHRPAGVILESAFTSVPDLGAELYPWLPVRRLARMDFDTSGHVRDAEVPVLVVHSPDDEIIPFEHGRRLYRQAGARGRFLEIHGDHNTGFLRSGELYRQGLDGFLDAVLSGPGRTETR